MSTSADVGIFTSTEIQSRLQEIEEEEEQKNTFSIFHRFAHSGITHSTSSSRVSQSKRKATKQKVNNNLKKLRKTNMSNTDRLVTIISGKPQKLRRRQPTIRPNNTTAQMNQGLMEDDCDDDTLLNARYWRKLKFSLNVHRFREEDTQASKGNDACSSTLFELANSIPEHDYQLLYTNRIETACRQFNELQPPLTLSQLQRECTPVLGDPAEVGVSQSTLSMDNKEVVVVSDSESEGEVIPMPVIHTVQISGPSDMELAEDCPHNVRMVKVPKKCWSERADAPEIPDSEEEDEDGQYQFVLEIRRW